MLVRTYVPTSLCSSLLQFCFEGMEESGSEGLDDLLLARKDTFLKVRLYFKHRHPENPVGFLTCD